jgi:hypothetical protein
MPLTCNPDSTYDVVLECDKHKEPDNQPAFVFQYLTGRKWKEVANLSDSFESASGGAAMLDLAFDTIKIALVGWKNLTNSKGEEIPFNLNELDNILTMTEATELMQAAVSQNVTVDDKKKLESQSDSSTEQSAVIVQAPQSAKINRP